MSRRPNACGWALGKTTNTGNSGEHIITTMDNNGKVFYTCSLTRLTPELQWDKKVGDNIDIPQMETSMNEGYVEEEHIDKTIIEEFFTKTRLNQKQLGHRLWVNNKERHFPPDLDNADLPATDNPTTTDIPPPPGLEPPQSEQSEQPAYPYVHPTPKAMAKRDTYKPTHRLTGKQPPQ
eukprot:1001008-Amphidinium_carterae.2